MRSGRILSILLPFAILCGLTIGFFLPSVAESLGSLINLLVLSLLFLLFFEIRLDPIREASRRRGFLFLAWVSNFILIPFLGWGIASILFGSQPALFAGLLLYFLFPCTDWFLAFTRIAKGDVILGSILIPINLVSQLLFFPVYLTLFIGSQTNFDLFQTWDVLVQWFLLPLLLALLVRFLLSRALTIVRFESLLTLAGGTVPWVLAALVCCIFCSNTPKLILHYTSFPLILVGVLMFFVFTWILSKLLTWRFRIGRQQHVLLVMTTAARNSPLMLGLATIALPDQPLVYATLIIGMLVEFPHLTLLSRLLLQKENLITPSRSNPVVTP